MEFENLIDNIVNEIALELETAEIKLPAISDEYLIRSSLGYQINYKKYSEDFCQIVEDNKCDKFFKDAKEKFPTHFPNIISQCVEKADTRYVINKNLLKKILTFWNKIISEGKMPYSIRHRLVNIAIDKSFIIEETENRKVFLQNISDEELLKKYPPDDFVNQICRPHWKNHKVEVVFEFVGLPKDVEEHTNIKGEDDLIKTITNSITISRILRNSEVYSTHMLLEAPMKKILLSRGFGGYTFNPVQFTKEDIENVKRNYNVISKTKTDKVLQTSIDRFLIGLKRDFQHPNKVNVPNWDKIVDYVIACETLFLTINKNSDEKGELSYRFKLNGCSLISAFCKLDKRDIFSALGDIYTIRSKVVHGCQEKDILKPVNKFIQRLNIDNSEHKHDIGRLILISSQIEEWISNVYTYLITLEKENRPYNKEGGWEALLWNENE